MTLEEIYNYYGNISKAAEAVNVSRQTFHKWMRTGWVPEKQQKLYEKLSDGKLKSKNHPEQKIDSNIYIPSFRYWSDTLGMCDVHSLTYFSDREPRIRYYDPANRQLIFSSFEVKNLMQSTIYTDNNNIRLFESDIFLIEGKEIVMPRLWDFETEDMEIYLSLSSWDHGILIVGNLYEGIKDGHKRSK
jgi:hypothetical protein